MAPPMCHGLLYILIYSVVYILIRIASHGRSRRGPGRERGGGRRDVSQCSKNTCVIGFLMGAHIFLTLFYARHVRDRYRNPQNSGKRVTDPRRKLRW